MTRCLSLLLLLTGCTLSLTEPVEPYEEITALAEWQAEYQWVWDHCGSEVRAHPAWPFARLRFFVVATDAGFQWQDYASAYGAWQEDRIFLARWAVSDRFVLHHELLHAQLGTGTHPPIFTLCAERISDLP